jgi:hypothetical protein
MRRIGFAVVALAAFFPAQAKADTLPLVDGVPATYTPGQSFTFTLRVPAMPDLTSYNLDITFDTSIANPPLVAFPTVATPSNTGEGYVFTSNANFNYTFDTPLGSSTRTLTISDFNSAVTTVKGTNDLLGTVTVSPGSNFTGDINISFNPDFQYNFREGQRYNAPDTITVRQGNGSAAPAPPGILLLALGGLLVAVRTRLARKPA